MQIDGTRILQCSRGLVAAFATLHHLPLALTLLVATTELKIGAGLLALRAGAGEVVDDRSLVGADGQRRNAVLVASVDGELADEAVDGGDDGELDRRERRHVGAAGGTADGPTAGLMGAALHTLAAHQRSAAAGGGSPPLSTGRHRGRSKSSGGGARNEVEG